MKPARVSAIEQNTRREVAIPTKTQYLILKGWGTREGGVAIIKSSSRLGLGLVASPGSAGYVVSWLTWRGRARLRAG